MDTVDWYADKWFAEHHASHITENFKHFWLEYYGPPDNYDQSYTEQAEYWVRCAFCWIGWSNHVGGK